MDPRRWSRAIATLFGVLLLLFAISLPGFGVETRPLSKYAAWAAPVFLVLTLLVFGSAITGLASSWRRRRTSAYIGIVAGATSIVTVLLDFSHVGGPPAPPGPLYLGILAIVVSLMIFGAAALGLRMDPEPPVPTSAAESTKLPFDDP